MAVSGYGTINVRSTRTGMAVAISVPSMGQIEMFTHLIVCKQMNVVKRN